MKSFYDAIIGDCQYNLKTTSSRLTNMFSAPLWDSGYLQEMILSC
jgi:hypothetical protein